MDNQWTILKALEDVEPNEHFRVVAGPSGHLTGDVWVKDEFVEEKDKYLCNTVNSSDSEGFTSTKRHFSPRFKVYVRKKE